MPDIRHRVGIAAPQHRVYEMLATKAGLAKFWTSQVEGDSEVGGQLRFFFGKPEPSAVMEVVELSPDRPGALAMRPRTGGMGRHDRHLRSENHWRRDRAAVHAWGLAGARRVHAPLQHQVGDRAGGPEKRARRRRLHSLSQRDEDQWQLALKTPREGAR